MAKGFDTNSILLNVGGFALVLFAAGYIVQDLWSEDAVQTCRDVYPAASEFPLVDPEGRALSPIELQARAGRKEWGVIENVRVVANKSGPTPTLMELTLAGSKTNTQRIPGARGGVGMNWTPTDLGAAKAACLGYNLFLPKDFDYGSAGILPGLYGGSGFDGHSAGNGKQGFAARLVWRHDGVGYINAQVPQAKGPVGLTIDGKKFTLQKGQWTRVIQEVVLNTPSKANGKLRLWIDGQLVIDKADMIWRLDDSVQVGGVVGNIDYGSVEKPTNTPKEVTLRLTPYTLSWQ